MSLFAGQLVDVSHIIAFTEAEYEIIKPTVLFNYVYGMNYIYMFTFKALRMQLCTSSTFAKKLHVVVFILNIFLNFELYYYAKEKSDWPEDRKGAALAMGFGSLFNHSRFVCLLFIGRSSKHFCFIMSAKIIVKLFFQPSLDHVYDYPNETIEYHALRDIVAGEELKITYGDELWFEDKEEMPAVFEEPR